MLPSPQQPGGVGRGGLACCAHSRGCSLLAACYAQDPTGVPKHCQEASMPSASCLVWALMSHESEARGHFPAVLSIAAAPLTSAFSCSCHCTCAVSAPVSPSLPLLQDGWSLFSGLVAVFQLFTVLSVWLFFCCGCHLRGFCCSVVGVPITVVCSVVTVTAVIAASALAFTTVAAVSLTCHFGRSCRYSCYCCFFGHCRCYRSVASFLAVVASVGV